jgi:hypothetical protein
MSIVFETLKKLEVENLTYEKIKSKVSDSATSILVATFGSESKLKPIILNTIETGDTSHLLSALKAMEEIVLELQKLNNIYKDSDKYFLKNITSLIK